MSSDCTAEGMGGAGLSDCGHLSVLRPKGQTVGLCGLMQRRAARVSVL